MLNLASARNNGRDASSSARARIEGGRRPADTPNASRSTAQPLVSVITVVFNGAEYLRGAIDSVLAQTYPSLEYIVVDGGSTDRTIEILRTYDRRIDYWLSEPDAGIYDAMNKGIRASTGTLIGILNADDRYAPYAAERAVRALSDPQVGYCYGWLRLVDSQGRDCGLVKPVPRHLFGKRVLREILLPHPTMFVRRSVYAAFGGFDSKLTLAGDFELIARIYAAGVVGVEIPEILAEFRLGGSSRSPRILREMRSVALRGGLSPLLAWKDWVLARSVMAAKRVLPPTATGWLRALKDLRRN
jgi:glycosyltransferase involved in cell wall biosynthesis